MAGPAPEDQRDHSVGPAHVRRRACSWATRGAWLLGFGWRTFDGSSGASYVAMTRLFCLRSQGRHPAARRRDAGWGSPRTSPPPARSAPLPSTWGDQRHRDGRQRRQQSVLDLHPTPRPVQVAAGLCQERTRGARDGCAPGRGVGPSANGSSGSGSSRARHGRRTRIRAALGHGSAGAGSPVRRLRRACPPLRAANVGTRDSRPRSSAPAAEMRRHVHERRGVF
jgi:hypothetical protein